MRKYYIHILLIVFATALYFLAHFQRIAVPAPIFDILQSDLKVSATKITTFSSVFMYCYALGNLICGLLIDKFGGVKILLYGACIFTIGSLLFGNTNELYLLYFARGLVGLGASTFYLGLLAEAKKCFPDKYFGIAISLFLFVGYIGGVCANAPLVMAADSFGWQSTLNFVGVISVIVTFMFFVTQHLLKPVHSNEHVKISPVPYIEVLKNKNNYYIFTFVILCTGLHYVIMTVIGVKFLTDFLGYSYQFSALLLSFLVIIAAFSGIILAYLSKMLGNNRLIFIKYLAFSSFVIFSIISILILFDIKTSLITTLIMLLAVNGGNTPIAVPIITNTNKHEIQTTAVSIMNSISFVFVGLIANVIGFILDWFPSVQNELGHVIYGKNSYLCVFLFFSVLAIIEIFVSFKIKEKL